MKKQMGVGSGLLLVALCATGCGAAGDSYEPGTEEEEALGSVDQQLWQHSTAAKWPGGVVPVCYDASIPAAQRNTIFNAIMQWDWSTPVKFTGWGNCAAGVGAGNVMIRLNTGLAAQGLAGISINGLGGGQFGRASTSVNIIELVTVSPANPRTVAHEMGHVLGFVHEHADNGTCNQRTSSGIRLTPNDVTLSIMSQSSCFTNPNLSANDILGVRKAYAKDPDGDSTHGGLKTYNTDPGNSEGSAFVTGNLVQCPGGNEVLVGVDQWSSSSRTIQCRTSPYDWALDVSGRRYAWSSNRPTVTHGTKNMCPDDYVAIGVDFGTNKYYCAQVRNGYRGDGTVSTAANYFNYELFGAVTEIHRCPGSGAIHGGNVNFNLPNSGNNWNFYCVQ